MIDPKICEMCGCKKEGCNGEGPPIAGIHYPMCTIDFSPQGSNFTPTTELLRKQTTCPKCGHKFAI